MSMNLLMKRYGIKNDDIDIMLTGILSTASISNIIDRMSVKVTKEQAYTIFRQLSLSQFGETLEYIAPHLVIEREQLSEPLKESWEQNRKVFIETKKQERREEDLFLAELEKKK